MAGRDCICGDVVVVVKFVVQCLDFLQAASSDKPKATGPMCLNWYCLVLLLLLSLHGMFGSCTPLTSPLIVSSNQPQLGGMTYDDVLVGVVVVVTCSN